MSNRLTVKLESDWQRFNDVDLKRRFDETRERRESVRHIPAVARDDDQTMVSDEPGALILSCSRR
jgi:hypothetical protein